MEAAARKSLALLEDLGLAAGVTYQGSTTSAVTTSWGVRWDEENIARDLLQNFFDANRDRLDAVTIDAATAVVRVGGPTDHDLAQLFFLGSEKDAESSIGQYGEGFKAAAMCLVRDFGIRPVARSRDRLVCIRLAEEPVAETRLHPLVYDWFTAATPLAGTELVLTPAPVRLRKAIRHGLTHFLYEGNALVGPQLWRSPDGAFAIHRSTQGDAGAVFYRRLRRAFVPEIPLVLVIDKEYARIEKLIRSDRDRNAFGERLMKLFYEVFARGGVRGSAEAQAIVVEAARPVWLAGHPLLAALADALRDVGAWPRALAGRVFGEGYFARSHPRNAAEHLRFEAQEKRWRDEGRSPLPGYFSAFGVIDARESHERASQTQLAESRRSPSQGEREAIAQLVALLRELAPEVHAIFARDRTAYFVARSPDALGALRRGRGWREREVFLVDDLFVGDFATAFATFMHEHAHIFGHDGDRGFTDALTEMLETAIRNRAVFDAAEQRWEQLRARVLAEREDAVAVADATAALREALAALDAPALRALLERTPPAVLRRLLTERRRPPPGFEPPRRA
jgi:hypothetical protein